ncbi:unnamed protein product [Calypogeia fissa]
MAAGISPAVMRPVIVSPLSLSGRRRIVLHGNRFGVCGIPLRERRRKRSVRCAYGEGFHAETADVKLSGVTLYELLGISRQVGISEIKSAYREKARRYHPDANPPSKRDECTKKFLQVQEAYEVLADPDLRADYDYRLRHPLSMHALTSGLQKGRSRRSRSWSDPTGLDDEAVVNKHVWKAQWEAQVEGLKRDLGRKKPGSWAAKMQQKRQEEAARREAEQQVHKGTQQHIDDFQ